MGNVPPCKALASKENSDGTMSTETFMVAFHNGYWRIGYDGRWYGTYPNRDSAEQVAIGIAMQTGELPTRVVVLEQDGSEEVVWQPSNQGSHKPTRQ
jgi:hypothetical protein